LAIAIAVVPAPLGSVRRQHRWPELGFRWEHERRDSGIGQHIVTTSTSSDPEEADDAGAKQGEQSGGQKHCAPFDATAAVAAMARNPIWLKYMPSAYGTGPGAPQVGGFRDTAWTRRRRAKPIG